MLDGLHENDTILRPREQLYRLDGSSPFGVLSSVFRGTIDSGLVREQWDQLVRLASSLRDRVHLQLNRCESRNALARRIFFANQGAFRVGDYEEIMNKVSALALISNAVLVWNTVRFAEIVAALQ